MKQLKIFLQPAEHVFNCCLLLNDIDNKSVETMVLFNSSCHTVKLQKSNRRTTKGHTRSWYIYFSIIKVLFNFNAKGFNKQSPSYY